MATPLFNSCGGYTTWLMDAGQPPWKQASEEARAVFEVRFDPAEFGDDLNHGSCAHILAQKAKFARWLDSGDSLTVANALLILLNRTVNMMDNLLAKHGDRFREEGGFHERMTAVRVEAKREQRAEAGQDAPACPQCGQPMRLRNGSKGEFWGCTAYPTCRGTLEVTK